MKWMIVVTSIIVSFALGAAFGNINAHKSWQSKYEEQEVKWVNKLDQVYAQIPWVERWYGNWVGGKLVEAKYRDWFEDKGNRYGNGKVHDVPWDKWNIKEKVFLCMFGCDGTRMNENDMKEFRSAYGPK